MRTSRQWHAGQSDAARACWRQAGGDALDRVHDRRLPVSDDDCRQLAAVRHGAIQHRTVRARPHARGAAAGQLQQRHVPPERHTAGRDARSDQGRRIMNIDFPFAFDARGRTAECDDAAHVRDMLEQLLFTNAGERVNRPDFGSGLLQLVFAPNSVELAATVQFTTQALLQQYLGDLITVRAIEVRTEDSTLIVELSYSVRLTGELVTAEFTR